MIWKIKKTNHKHKEGMMKALFICMMAVFWSFTNQVDAFYDNSHANTAEDTIIYMQTQGSNQQRWIIDYLKAKSGGRNFGQGEEDLGVKKKLNNDFDKMRTVSGLIGLFRAGAIVPDYFQDFWWDDFIGTDWHFSNPVGYQNNYTSYSHFMNLLRKNDNGINVIANVYNDFDGYSYNGSFGANTGVGYDSSVAVLMNNAKLAIDLQKCVDKGKCDEYYSMIPNANPAFDYKQNGSITPLGKPDSNGFGADDGSNYNCYSDTQGNHCPDKGEKVEGWWQIPNVHPGDGDGFWDFTYNKDWVIMEPLDNAATFYYNEWFLEGGKSRNNTLDVQSIKNRYYSLTSSDINFLSGVLHYAGDANVQVHIWNTLGYNHAAYEEWIEGKNRDDGYGKRVVNGNDPNKNFESHSIIQAYINGRANTYNDRLDVILTENALLTYLARENRSESDILFNEDNSNRKNAAVYAVNQAIASLAIVVEKGVMDLRKYR